MKNLVIVESPAKAKMIQKFLGNDYVVKASMGHIRDLPDRKADLPPSKQKLPYASLAINIEKNFEPIYVIKPTKKKVVKELKSYMKEGTTVWIATDEDREGEAIGYHLTQILKIDPKETKRIVFHEITKEAILEAIAKPRIIDANLFDAQQARRILDRLVGYKLSPLLWTKIRYGLSAGRVQSVAVRLIVEKEREIQAFDPKEFWKLKSYYSTPQFDAELSSINGTKLNHKDEEKKIGSAEQMSQILKDLDGKDHTITNIEQKDAKSSPSAPYITSTLQQEASSKLGFGVKQTMMVAQRLYEGNVKKKSGVEGGFITYMRTDSTSLSDKALTQAKQVITKEFGAEYALSAPRRFKTKSKGAQEAHEAIRPTNLAMTPKDAAPFLDERQLKLYTLIWRRTLACQMAPARLKKTTAEISAGPHEFTAEGSIIEFPGYLKVYQGSGRKADQLDSKQKFLPALEVGQTLTLAKVTPVMPDEVTPEESTEARERDYIYALNAFKIEPKVEGLIPVQNFTKPPARYTEASLVKKLESLGIGRPSTYAPTINTIQARKYVEKKEDKKLYPTDVGMVVCDFLVEHFSDILSYDFTARVENELDEVAEGKIEWHKMIGQFYAPFAKELEDKKEAIKRYDVITEETDVKCYECKENMEIKLGRYGKFLSCTGYPDCKGALPINPDGTPGEPFKPEPTGEKCPDCEADLITRRGRFGEFVGCGAYPKCKYIKKDEKKIGVNCAKCEKGELVEKKTRRGKIFFGCNKYPDCDSAFWDNPISKTCKKCGPKQLMVLKQGKGEKSPSEVCPVCTKGKRGGKKKAE
ncbi:MAG: type I DNA topoisomerase [Candidatus Gracilibacteria bacterium]|nr:type I DNA topoisomerase [Candidatus Gracilibacteria bacterium]